MNTVLLVMSICSFIMGTFGMIAHLNGNPFLIFSSKVISLFGVLTSVIYWLQLLGVIK